MHEKKVWRPVPEKKCVVCHGGPGIITNENGVQWDHWWWRDDPFYWGPFCTEKCAKEWTGQVADEDLTYIFGNATRLISLVRAGYYHRGNPNDNGEDVPGSWFLQIADEGEFQFMVHHLCPSCRRSNAVPGHARLIGCWHCQSHFTVKDIS